MANEVDKGWIVEVGGSATRWCWCHDDIVKQACEQCALCNADNVELQMDGFDQVLVSRFPNGEMHLIEWRWSRGER